MSRAPWSIGATLLLSFASLTCWAASSRIVDLGIGNSSDAWAINNRGEIVGVRFVPDLAMRRAFLRTRDGQILDLGSFRTEPNASSIAVDINDHGEAVGTSSAIQQLFVAFTWTRAAGMRSLGTLPGDDRSSALALNNRGEVVGDSCCSHGAPRAVLWSPAGTARDLGVLGGEGNDGFGSSAADINEQGHVVGNSMTNSSSVPMHAFFWSARDGMIDLGTLGGNASAATAINDRDEVVGTSFTANGFQHAFFWSRHTGMIDLGTLGGVNSSAEGINNRSEVVGSAGLPTQQGRAFIWRPYHPMFDLGALTDEESRAHDINASGEIVGVSVVSGSPVAVLWTRRLRLSPPQ